MSLPLLSSNTALDTKLLPAIAGFDVSLFCELHNRWAADRFLERAEECRAIGELDHTRRMELKARIYLGMER